MILHYRKHQGQLHLVSDSLSFSTVSMASHFTRLSGKDESSCRFSSNARSLWNLQEANAIYEVQSSTLPYFYPDCHELSTSIGIQAMSQKSVAVELCVVHPAVQRKVVKVALNLGQARGEADQKRSETCNLNTPYMHVTSQKHSSEWKTF